MDLLQITFYRKSYQKLKTMIKYILNEKRLHYLENEMEYYITQNYIRNQYKYKQTRLKYVKKSINP